MRIWTLILYTMWKWALVSIFFPTASEAQASSEQNDEYSDILNMMDFNFALEEAEEERK